MNFSRMAVAPALFAAATALAGAAQAEVAKHETGPAGSATATNNPPTTATASAAASAHGSDAVQAPAPMRAPADWIVYDDITYTPVVDDVSRHLSAARKALAARDGAAAAAELRAASAALKAQGARAAADEASLVRDDETLLAADRKSARDATRRVDAGAAKIAAAAAAVEDGRVGTTAQLDKVIDKAARADIEHRWRVSDVTTWYPVSAEPQRHFTDAASALARKDYRAAATDIRKAAGYMRLETDRATGDARHELARSVAELDRLAVDVEKGAVTDERTLDRDFTMASHALALAHRARAIEAWTRKEYVTAGYELRAAAQGLESAAHWVGGATRSGATASVADVRTLADSLVAGGTWTREEVAKAFESLGNDLDALGRKIAGSGKAAPLHVGA